MPPYLLWPKSGFEKKSGESQRRSLPIDRYTFDGCRRAVGMLNPVRAKNEGHLPGTAGERDDTCACGLSRSPIKK